VRKLLLSAVVLLAAAGCRTGLGEACDADSPCPEGLVCNVPAHPEGSVDNPQGICDYAPRKEGEVCSLGEECERALTCSNHFAPGTRYGTCVPRREAGEACFLDRDCKKGVCLGASGTALDGVCGEEES
jgi:hypothetical protein